jgi:hypothetical protein
MTPQDCAVAIVSDDPRISSDGISVFKGSAQLLRSEQALFGALSQTAVVVIDTQTCDSWMLLPIQHNTRVHRAAGIESAIAIASDLGVQSGFAQGVLASHAVDALDVVQPTEATLQLPSLHAPPAHTPLPIVAVVNAVGGAGSSTASWVIAAHFARYIDTVLIDADDRSPGLDLWTCDESTTAVRWPELAGVQGVLDSSRLWDGLICLGPRLRLLSHSRTQTVLSLEPYAAVLAACEGAATVIDISSQRVSPVLVGLLRHASAVVVVTQAAVSGCAAASTRIGEIQSVVSADTDVICALRMSRPRISLAAARAALPVPVVALPEEPRVTRLLHCRRFDELPRSRWRSLLAHLPEQTPHAATSHLKVRPIRQRLARLRTELNHFSMESHN